MGAGASTWSTEELARCLELRDDELAWFAFDVRASGVDGASLLAVGEDRDRLLQLTRSGGADPGHTESLVRHMREFRAQCDDEAQQGTIENDEKESDGDRSIAPKTERPIFVVEEKAAQARASDLELKQDDEESEDDVESDDEDYRSFKAQYDPKTGRSFFAADLGVLTAKISNGSEHGDKKSEYASNTMIVHDGEPVGEIIKLLGKGGMGYVYELRLANGKSVAAKSVRADLKAAEQAKLELSLAREVAIGFSAARGPQIASVIRVLIPLPDIETTIAGLLVLCDLVDGGDLEEAMHSGKRKRGGDLEHDYSGALYTEHGANTWPLASITLQILLGLNHLHEHGIIHQVGEELIRGARGLGW